MSTDTKKAPAGTVHVRVRARGAAVYAWAGEAWTREWREFDASPAHVEDLRKAPAGYIAVEWPAGFKFPDGSSPVDPTVPRPEEVGDLTSADVVTRHVKEAEYFQARAIAAERELNDLRLDSNGVIGRLRSELETVIAKQRELESSLQASEHERIAAIALAQKANGATEAAIAASRSAAAAEIDTAKAQAQAIITETKASCDALLAQASDEITKLTSERDALLKLTAPKSGGKPPKADAT